MNLDTTTPEVFMTPMALEPCSLNQMWSSGPVAMVSAEVMGDPTPWAQTVSGGEVELVDDWRHCPRGDFADAVGRRLGEPQVAVRADRDAVETGDLAA